jgi:alkylation response protein AidB-like acyl-CoA dehydrogenase
VTQFALSEDQLAIQEMAQRFTADALTPHAAEWDEKHIFPRDTIRAAAELGFGAIYVSEESGGIGLGRLEAALIMEAMAYGDPSTSAFISIHNMASWMIDRFGSDTVKAEVSAQDGDDGAYRLLLPHRAGLRLRRGRAQDRGGEGRRPLCRLRLQGVHLGRRRERGLCDHGPHRPRRARGDQRPGHREGHAGRQLRRAGEKLGWHSQPTAQVNFDEVRCRRRTWSAPRARAFASP